MVVLCPVEKAIALFLSEPHPGEYGIALTTTRVCTPESPTSVNGSKTSLESKGNVHASQMITYSCQ